jgi:hypothetical protein
VNLNSTKGMDMVNAFTLMDQVIRETGKKEREMELGQ